MFLPFRDRPQTWVRPRKSKLVPSVSGWLRALSSLWAEVDEARLVGVEGESIPCEALAKDRPHAFGVINVVERHQRVVSKPDKGAPPSQTRFHLSLEPFVQHVVQEDVREARRDYTPLRGALGRVAQQTVFHGSCFQPFIDHPSDDAVRDSLVKEHSKVGVWDRIEILAYVDIEYPVKPLGPQHILQSPQRLVSRPPRPEAV